MKSVMNPAAAFPAPQPQPDEAALKKALGRAFALLAEMIESLRKAHPAVTAEWKYSPQSGWHQIYFLKKRRLVYLVPGNGDFRLSLILGGKALALLKRGEFAAEVELLLKDAKRYPEGTAFRFERSSFRPGLVLALLEAKLSPEPKRGPFRLLSSAGSRRSTSNNDCKLWVSYTT